jgi:hypothetical protein
LAKGEDGEAALISCATWSHISLFPPALSFGACASSAAVTRAGLYTGGEQDMTRNWLRKEMVGKRPPKIRLRRVFAGDRTMAGEERRWITEIKKKKKEKKKKKKQSG